MNTPGSMKAGAFTPAIPVAHIEAQRAPLNEGGGFHPRNPGSYATPSSPLNEGGGFHPRNP